MSKETKRCIILSEGPVPTPEHTKVEGGGLRCWGLARGIHANNSELEVTVAYNEAYRTEKFTDKHEGVHIRTWNLHNIAELIQEYDTVLVSYCMGELSVRVADAIRSDQQLVLDCYVPIYVEVSARNSNDMQREYEAFHSDVGRWAHVLKRGDVFLCASEPQANYYKGVLSAVGRINPATYGKELIRVVPYGIYREEPNPTEKPIQKLLGKDSSVKKILWFGGIYPWFDLRNLVDAVGELNKDVPAKLIIVGAKNPFNNHPDFLRPYEQLVEHIEVDKKLKDLVVLQDWIQFEKRADWYLDSDLVVVVNKIGEENKLAWRTRLVDFMWADLPILTNGGDPLGETLLNNHAAARLHGLKATEVAQDLREVLKDKEEVKKIRANLGKLKKNYYWDVATKQLAEDIATHHRAFDLEQFGDRRVVLPTPETSSRSKLKKAVSKARMLPAYAKKYGMRNTYFTMKNTIGNQFRKVNIGVRSEPRVIMISHQLDNSGAPYVFMDLAQSIVDVSSPQSVVFHTFNPATKDSIVRLNKMGIKPKIHLSKDIEIEVISGDTVVLNTAVHSMVLKNGVFSALEDNRARKLIWFVHEDDPEMLFSKSEVKRIRKLLESDKIVLFIAAQKTLKNYQKLFGNTHNIRLQPYRYEVAKKYQKIRPEKDFDTLRFILPGTIGDGRKGQLPILYAFGAFKRTYYQKNPKVYRNFELTYIGMSDDFLSRQISNHAPTLLGDNFKPYGRMSHDETLALIHESNATICYSLREALPLFVFEGMAAGHPILRNDCSGMEEQLFKGKNGFYLESKDFNQLIDTFEEVLNKEKTSNATLAKMSEYSHGVAMQQAQNSYGPIVSEVMNLPDSTVAKATEE